MVPISFNVKLIKTIYCILCHTLRKARKELDYLKVLFDIKHAKVRDVICFYFLFFWFSIFSINVSKYIHIWLSHDTELPPVLHNQNVHFTFISLFDLCLSKSQLSDFHISLRSDEKYLPLFSRWVLFPPHILLYCHSALVTHGSLKHRVEICKVFWLNGWFQVKRNETKACP